MLFLTVEDIERLHLQIIEETGGSLGIRDSKRLHAAVATQTQQVFGEVLYKKVFDKAAALCRGTIGDHPFVDGNKRTGIVTGLLFLELNNIDLGEVPHNELEDFAVRVATQKLTVDEIAVWLEAKANTTLLGE